MTRKLSLVISLFLTAVLSNSLRAQENRPLITPVQGEHDAWAPKTLMTPDTLRDFMETANKRKLVILHTGPSVLFKKGHIPRAIAMGEVSDSAGANALKKRLRTMSKKSELVLYCGCCPWKNCPNIRPAYAIVREMGFTNVKVLYLPNTFKLDWEKRGFPVEK